MARRLNLRDVLFVVTVVCAFLAGFVAGRMEFDLAMTRQRAKAGAHDAWRDRALKAEKRLLELGDPQASQEAGNRPIPDSP